VEEAQTINATFSDNSKLAVQGFKYVAPARDLAVLQTAPPQRELPFLQLAKKDPVKNDGVVAFGSPAGASFFASEGIVNRIRAGKKPGDLAELGADLAGIWAQISAQVSPDNSGGPLVNRAGDVVGMNATTLAAEQNFALARDELRLALDKARAQQVTPLDKLPPARSRPKAAAPAIDAEVTPAETGQLARTDLSQQESENLDKLSAIIWFGAKYRDIKELGPVAKNSLGRKRTDSGAGVAVDEIWDDSPASRAGMQKDDLIGTFDGKPVVQASDIQELVDQFQARQDVKVSVLRPQPNGRFSKKMLTVHIEALIDPRALDYVATADVPAEVRDFLKRHLLRYAAKLFETANPVERPKTGGAPVAGGKQASAATGGASVQAFRQKSPFAPPFAPAFGTDVPARLGNIGNLERVRVLTVVNQKMAVARIKGGLIALLADTSSLIKGKQAKDELFNLGRAQIIGTVTVPLDEKNARTATIFVARPFAVEAYLPQWPSPPAAER
jgi:S1-C subfamily serine protease